MKNKKFLKNAISGFGGQLIIVILGIIVPRIMILNYGSDLNGLVGTISQIYTYLALLEAGIGQSARVALYKSIHNGDKKEISKVVITAEKYYRRVTLFYFLGVIAISFVFPLVVNSEVEFSTAFLASFLEGMAGVISFYYIQTPTVLLNADGRAYINNYVIVLDRIACYLVKIVLASLGINIVLVQLSFFIINILKVFVYKIYIKRNYDWIERNQTPDYRLLKDKNSYLLTEIAWTIFASTDMIIISVFVNTKLASVYSIYNMVFNNLNLLLKSIGGSIIYVLGQKYNQSIEEYKKYHNAFDSFFMTMITVLMAACYLLIFPFIKLYTKGVYDVDYIQSQLPILFALIQMVSWNRYVTGNLTALAGYAKETSFVSMIEAAMNVVLSITLVNIWGITGVLIATLVSLPIKVIWCIYITDVKVFCRSCLTSIKIYGINYLLFLLLVLISNSYSLNTLELHSYSQFALLAIGVVISMGAVIVGTNILVNREIWCFVKTYIKKRLLQH